MIFGIEPANAAIGGVFTLLLGIFTVTVRLLTATQNRSDRRNDLDVDRLNKELEAVKEERDEYRDKWLDSLAELHHPQHPPKDNS